MQYIWQFDSAPTHQSQNPFTVTSPREKGFLHQARSRVKTMMFSTGWWQNFITYRAILALHRFIDICYFGKWTSLGIIRPKNGKHLVLTFPTQTGWKEFPT